MSSTALSFRGHARAMLLLSIPLVGSHLAHALIGLTDTVMLGWYSIETLAAGALANSFFFTLFVVGSGFSHAVMPMVASAASADNTTQIRRVTRMGLWLSVIAGGVLMPIMWWSAPILRLLGQNPEIADLAQVYLRIAGWGMFPALLVMVLKSYLAALERAQVIFWVTVFGGIGNAAGNWLLIFGNWGFPELGIAGAGIATLLNHCLMLLGLAVFIRRKLPQHVLFQRLWRSDWEAFRAVYKLGWPIGLTHLAESGLFTATALMVGWIGTQQLAAHGIAMQITSTMFMVHIGLSQAATVRAGRALGRDDISGLLRGGKAAILWSLLMIGITMTLFLCLPGPLIGLFLSPSDPQAETIIAIGIGLMAVAALFQLADGMQVMAMGLLRGVQDTRTPMIHAIVSYWALGMPTGYVLGFWTPLAEIGVWLGLVVGLFCAAILLQHRFWVQRRWIKD